jgi:hypothetical protein
VAVFSVSEHDGPAPALSCRLLLQAPDIGKFQSCQVISSGSGLGAAWHLAYVTVTNTTTSESVRFVYGDWLDAKKGWTQTLYTDAKAKVMGRASVLQPASCTDWRAFQPPFTRAAPRRCQPNGTFLDVSKLAICCWCPCRFHILGVYGLGASKMLVCSKTSILLPGTCHGAKTR